MFDGPIREFASPITPNRKPGQAKSPATVTAAPAVTSFGLDENQAFIRIVQTALNADPAFRSIVEMVVEMSPRDRDTFRRSIRFWWGYLTGTERGMVIKAHRGELLDEEVAEVAGVARETLVKSDRFQNLKRLLSAKPLVTVKRRGRTGRRFDTAGPEDCNSSETESLSNTGQSDEPEK